MEDCIEWTGGVNSKGYGRKWVNGKLVTPHRHIYEETYGPVPTGIVVMHICDNPRCYNIKHFTLGTPKDNSEDMVTKGRQAKGEELSKKLTESDVLAIRSSTLSHCSLGELYGVSQSTITRILQRKTWRHI
ncbi:gene 7.7 [Escherichia phage T7]|uniref:Gene 7.7 n=1 Tax=Escherichia phage T7 TaxID=10760 RepID=Q6WY27_BPT7|nr:gene 7.7 [Escherichia phage T7]AAP34154.1 gene 7.7 [Escherichia phage T7]